MNMKKLKVLVTMMESERIDRQEQDGHMLNTYFKTRKPKRCK